MWIVNASDEVIFFFSFFFILYSLYLFIFFPVFVICMFWRPSVRPSLSALHHFIQIYAQAVVTYKQAVRRVYSMYTITVYIKIYKF